MATLSYVSSNGESREMKAGDLMAQVMLAPNPRRNGGIDRVIVIGTSDDSATVRVAGVDGIANAEAFKRRYYKHVTGAAHFKLVALVFFLAGVAGAIFYAWWCVLIGIIAAIVANRMSKGTEAETLAKIVREESGAGDLLAASGLVWEASAKSVVAT